MSTLDTQGRESSTSATQLERTARAHLESRMSRKLTDLEWTRARQRLVEFALILRDWSQESYIEESDLRKVA
jgi:hypothetical protein